MAILEIDETTPTRLDTARALLTPVRKPEPAWPALAAAALFAVSGLAFAFAAITAQPSGFKPVPEAEAGP